MNRATVLPLLIALVSAAPLAAQAQADADATANPTVAAADDDKAFQQWADAERQRIAAGRAAADARYADDRRVCWQRFAVNACLDDARDRRRAILDVLRHDELTLNARQRDRRTAARLDELARKQAESAQRNAHPNQTPTPASDANAARAPR